MSRSWNHKAFIDRAKSELWGATTSNVILWINEIQDDIASKLPVDYYKFDLKKLLPTDQAKINLSPEIPSAPTTALSAGGSLVDDSTYKVYVTFVIYDSDTRKYIESEPSLAGTARQAGSSNNTIDLTDVATYSGDTTIEPTTIYRNIYVSTLASGESTYGEPFYHGQIADNTTTTYSISSEPSSTVTPPSSTEVDQVSSDHLIFASGNKYLQKIDSNRIKRYDPNQSNSATPDAFDYEGLDEIYLYPKLSSSATTAQRTLQYSVFRRPHESFYDVDREIDLPIVAKKALIAGVTWKGWEFKDRDGWVSKLNLYEKYRDELIDKLKRQRGAPSTVRDVNGDTMGYEVN